MEQLLDLAAFSNTALAGEAEETTVFLKPDPAAMITFLSLWFASCTAGFVELGWKTPGGTLSNFRQFPLGAWELIAAFACEINATPGYDTYFRPATMRQHDGASNKSHFVQSPGAWGDIDDALEVDRAIKLEAIIRPFVWVQTGSVPGLRKQTYFKTEEPITDAEVVQSLNKSVHSTYLGDPAVTSPSNLMRLPGSVSWPKPEKPGRKAELVKADYPENVPPYTIDEMQSYLPPTAEKGKNRPAPDFKDLKAVDILALEKIYHQLPNDGYFDNRDKWVKLAHATKAAFWDDYYRGLTLFLEHAEKYHKRKPSGTREEAARVYDSVYAPHFVGARFIVDCARECGIDVSEYEWAALARDFTFEVRPADQSPMPDGRNKVISTGQVDGRGRQPELLSISELKNRPPATFLVQDLILENTLIALYGAPKSGKSFLALSMALHIAAGQPWFGMKVDQSGVVYIAGEGIGGLGLRIGVMQKKHGFGDDLPFWARTSSIQLADSSAVDALSRMIEEKVPRDQPLHLIVIDTLSRAMAGLDENQTADMSRAVAACDLLRVRFGCAVLLVHHEGKDSSKGLRGSSALLGAIDTSIHIQRNEENGIVTLEVEAQRDADLSPAMNFEMEPVQAVDGRSSLVPILVSGVTVPIESEKLARQARAVLKALRAEIKNRSAARGRDPSPLDREISKEAFRAVVYRDLFQKLKAGSRTTAFSRALSTLVKQGLVGCRDGWIWPIDGPGAEFDAELYIPVPDGLSELLH